MLSLANGSLISISPHDYQLIFEVFCLKLIFMDWPYIG